MGAEIAATNAAALAARLRAYRARLDAWIALLEARGPRAPDVVAIRERLRPRARGWTAGTDGPGLAANPDELVLVVPRDARWARPAGGASCAVAWSPICAVVAREGRFAPRTAMERIRAGSRSSRTSSCATASAGS